MKVGGEVCDEVGNKGGGEVGAECCGLILPKELILSCLGVNFREWKLFYTALPTCLIVKHNSLKKGLIQWWIFVKNLALCLFCDPGQSRKVWIERVGAVLELCFAFNVEEGVLKCRKLLLIIRINWQNNSFPKCRNHLEN